MPPLCWPLNAATDGIRNRQDPQHDKCTYDAGRWGSLGSLESPDGQQTNRGVAAGLRRLGQE